MGCNATDVFTDEFLDKEDEVQSAIFLVERGDCSFVTKTRNIARAGGKVAVIIDSKNENIANVILSDDGTGAGIRIPSVMIGSKDGQILKEFFTSTGSPQDKKSVRINVKFDAVHRQPRPDITFWYTSSDDRSMSLIKNLGEFFKDILKNIQFIPKTVSYPCPTCEADFKKKHCLGNGMYCAMTKDVSSTIQGKDILMEDLRQYCVWDNLFFDSHKPKYFDYMSTVHEFCPNGKISRKCHELGMQKVNLNQTLIDLCVKNTFDNKGKINYSEDTNVVLRDNQLRWLEHGTHLYPGVVINGETFRGQVNPDNILEAVCESFTDMPRYCKTWLKKEGIVVEDGISNFALGLIIFGLLVVNLIIVIAYRAYLNKEIKQEMKMQVSSAVSQYIALSQFKELNTSSQDTSID